MVDRQLADVAVDAVRLGDDCAVDLEHGQASNGVLGLRGANRARARDHPRMDTGIESEGVRFFPRRGKSKWSA